MGQADPDLHARDQQVTLEQVLAKAAERIDGNPRFADKPAVEARLCLVIGNTYYRLGNFAAAEPFLRRAVELLRALFGPDDVQTLEAKESLADLLVIGLGRFAEAETLS